jgi:AraC-like DNA-binding protein
LLHCFIEGAVQLETNGRIYEVNSGSVVYYHEQEYVKNYFRQNTVFFSIAFKAPDLSPLPLNKRCFKVDKNIVKIFQAIYESYVNNPHSCSLELYVQLLALLQKLGLTDVEHCRAHTPGEKFWYEVEAWIRKGRRFRVEIKDLCRRFNISPATLYRSCRKTTGISIAKRLQQIRMSEARTLLKYSDLNITETAEYLGYSRIHEFSREFSAYYKYPASSLKKG